MKLRTCMIAATMCLLLGASRAAAGNKPNVLFIVADDMNFDSSDVYGGPIKDLTPNLDRLASEGLRFQHAYSTVAVCQPVREIMQTALYPHRNGAMGFFQSEYEHAVDPRNAKD